MKTAKKALLLSLCALVLVAATVMGTLAFLTSQDEVVNTFTVGKINISLDEAPTDEFGNIIPGDRRQENKYTMIPNHLYTKDPIVHVKAGSEACYVYIKIDGMDNPEKVFASKQMDISIADYDSRDKNGVVNPGITPYEPYGPDAVVYDLLRQIRSHGWQGVPGTGLWYQEVTREEAAAGKNLPVFERFGIKASINEEGLKLAQKNQLNVTAYAIQKDGFDTPKAAWDAVGGNFDTVE